MVTAKVNKMKDEVEKNLNACVFIPPRPIGAQYKLFQALKVEGEKDTSRAEFSPINSGLVEMLKTTNEQGLAALGGFEIKEDPLINDINRAFDSEIASSGGFGIDVLVQDHDVNLYNMNISSMKMTSVDDTPEVGALLERCVGEFCNYSDGIRHVFQQTSTFNFNENIQYGLAFVTSVITGSMNISEASTNSGNAGATAAVPVVGDGDGDGDVRAYRNSSNISGVVGIRVYFIHLVKENTGMNPGNIRIKASFPVSRSNDKYLTDALRTKSQKNKKRRYYIPVITNTQKN